MSVDAGTDTKARATPKSESANRPDPVDSRQRGHGDDAASPGARARTKSARSSDGGAAAAAPLVHRKQSFTPGVDEARRQRYKRRSAGSEWLIRQARLDAGMVPVAEGEVDPSTGEILPVTSESVGWVRPPRPARCSWRIGQTVPVHSDGKRAHFSGTERCSSVWACPVCASVIRAERSREIVAAVEQHQAAGGSVVLLTLTARHRKRDGLAGILDGVMTSWQQLLRGKAWLSFRERWGVAGYIRSVEVTYGHTNGWHPHVHALLLLDRSVTEAEAETMGDEIHGRWSRYVHQRTGRMPTRAHGVDVQRVDGEGKVLAEYIAKVQDTTGKRWDVGAELARSDVKVGKGSTSLVPFELLDRPVDEDGSYEWARRLWVEYVTATKGRRAITWSKGLKDHFDLEEATDEEIIEEAEAAPVRWLAEGRGYDRLRRMSSELLASVLDHAERENWEDVARLLPGAAPPDRSDE